MRLFTNCVTLTMSLLVVVSCSSSSDLHGRSLSDPVAGDLQSVETVTQVTEIPDAHQHDQFNFTDDTPGTTGKAELFPAGTDGLVTYDESIPDSNFHAYYIYHDDVQSLSSASDIVFTGRVTNYIESILTYLPPETESIGGHVDVYDGIVFTVDELLSGELPGDTREVIVLVYAAVTDKQGTPVVRISESPVEVIKAGIEQRNLQDGPTYLVFALVEDDPSSPYYNANPNYFSFNTPGSVVEVLADGNLGIGVDRPLSSTKTNELEDTEPVNLLTLADVRSSVQVTEEDSNVPDATPNDILGDLTPTDSAPGTGSTG